MTLLALPRGDWLLIVGGALLYGAAFPPFHLFVPSFICLIPAAMLLLMESEDGRPLRRHVVQGFWFGLLAQALTLHWLVVALWHFTPLSAVAYGVTALALAVYTAVVFGVTSWVGRRLALSLTVTLPIFWTAAEWIVAHHGELRFPWLGLGTSLTGFPKVVQVADTIGARGITFLLVLANVALALAWMRRARWYDALRPAGLVAGGVALALAYGVVRERMLTLQPVGTMALLQPNIGWSEKWEASTRDSVFASTLQLARHALGDRDIGLVVWPEAAVPGYFHEHPEWHRAVAEASYEAGVPQLVGGLDLDWIDRENGRFNYFNAAFLFDSLGRQTAETVYRKQYLVPVTERVPFLEPQWFDVEFFGGFSRGRERPLFEVGVGRFGVLICYESAFEGLARFYRANGAEFLVNITNDAWFGRTSGPYQHAAHLVMRAIENRVGIVRAANSGISEFVNPIGRTRHQTALMTRTVAVGDLVTSGVIPPYVRLGDWVGTAALVLAVSLIGLAGWRRT